MDYDTYNFQYGKVLRLANPYLKKEDEVLFSKLFINLCDNLNNKKREKVLKMCTINLYLQDSSRFPIKFSPTLEIF